MRSHGISSIISIPRGWEVWHLLWYPSHHRGVWAAPTVGNLLRADARHGQPMKFWWNRKFSLKHGKEIQYSKEVGKQSSELRMAAWLLHGACWGGSRSTKPCVFPCKVAAGGDERYLVCAAVAAAVVSSSNRFLLCVLQRVFAHVCVVLCACWISDRRSQCNGCMIAVTSCCHVRRDMQVRDVMLQNAM